MARARTLPIAFTAPDEFDARSRAAVERCIAAYQRAAACSVAVAPSLWDYIEDNIFSSLTGALKSGNVDAVFQYLSQMFLTPLTCGVSKKWTHDLDDIRRGNGPCPHQLRLTDSIVNLALAVGAARRTFIEQQGPEAGEAVLDVDLELLVEATENRTGLSLDHPRVGACFGYALGSRIVNSDCAHHTYTVQRLKQLGANSGSRIAEIGGGYGCLASLFARAGHGNYQIYDLPSVNVLQGYFLIMALPARTIRLFGEADGDIAVLPFWLFAELPARGVDYVINTDSLPEIGLEPATRYIADIARTCRGQFLSINHEAGVAPGIGRAPSQPQNRVLDLVEKHGGFQCLSRQPWWMREGYVEEVYRPAAADGS